MNRQLAAEIDKLFDEAQSHTVGARVREIFAEYGVPSNEMVGEEEAEEYVTLVSGETLDFIEKVLPQLKQAAAGKLSENSYIYLRAQLRQKEVREKFSGPPANPALQNEIERFFKTDQAVFEGARRAFYEQLLRTNRRSE